MEELNLFRAEAVNVQCLAGDEMLQPLHSLRRADEPAGAAAPDIFLALGIDFPHRVRSADRALVRHLPGLAATIFHDTEDLWNHIPCPLDLDRIAGLHT